MKVDFRRILCATDLTEFSNQAVRFGIVLAETFLAKLFVCHVVPYPAIPMNSGGAALPVDYLDDVTAFAKQELAALVGDRAVEWAPLVASGSIPDTIADLVAEHRIDLLVVATHGRTGIKRLFLGSVTERLLRTTSRPLMIVTPPAGGAQPDDPAPRFNRILAGCDFSQDSVNALTYALSLAQEFESELHLVHVIEPIAYRDVLLPSTALNAEDESLVTPLDQRLQALVPESARNWCDVRPTCLNGRPYEALTAYAESENVDLIVLGVRGHGLVEQMLLGSTTDRVIRHTTRPVLSVSAAAAIDGRSLKTG
jgi:nucleotide-binding universal stress UspA family protein